MAGSTAKEHIEIVPKVAIKNMFHEAMAPYARGTLPIYSGCLKFCVDLNITLKFCLGLIPPSGFKLTYSTCIVFCMSCCNALQVVDVSI